MEVKITTAVKVQVTLPPNFFFLSRNLLVFHITSANNFISIEKIPAILQAFKVAITELPGIWISLLMTSSKDMAQSTRSSVTKPWNPWNLFPVLK